MTTSGGDVLVVGAGPTGLMTALLLARDGVAVRVVDRNPAPVAQSRALVVQARTLELWHKLGLDVTALAAGVMLRGGNALLDGRQIGRGMLLDLAAFGASLSPYAGVLVLGQDQTERMLLDALAGLDVTVDRATEVVAVDQDGERAAVTLRRAGEEQVRHAAYVVGADGAHSAVRRAVGARFEGEAHDGAFFLADVAVDWDRGYRRELTVALDGDGGMVLFVPMHDPDGAVDRFRVFGSLVAHRADDQEVTLGEVQRRVDARGGVRARLRDPRWIAVYRLSSRRTDTFSRGRVFLAGDAAHIHTPTGGQGMNTGLQDAYNLGWKLSAVLRRQARPDLLDSYAAERVPVARALLRGTDAAFATISANGRRTRVLRPVVARLLPILTRVPAVGRRIFTTIGQLGVGYRGSPAVGGEAGRVAAPGDRAPWAAGPAGDVFDLLVGTGHHLLAFPGDPAAREVAAVSEVVAGFAMPVTVHTVGPYDAAIRRAYGVRRPTAVLVRPDGYIAWRGALDDVAGLATHLGRWYRPAVAAAVP